jgi:hypothetical protein
MIEKLTIVLGDEVQELNPDAELKLSEEDINENLKNQPSLYAFYAVMYEAAESELADRKFALETLEAVLDEHVRAEAATAGTKVTETMIANRIRLNEDYQNAVIALNQAKAQSGKLRAIKEAFVHRKDMLVTLASNMRAQADPEIFIKKEQFKNKS